MVKNSYCTGEEGKKAFEEVDRLRNRVLEEVGLRQEIEWLSSEDGGKHADIPDDTQLRADLPAKKRTIEEMKGSISEEDIEEYRKKRMAANDPMAGFLGKDELVH